MNHQLQEDRGSIEDLALRQVAEALLQTHLQRDELKEPLKDDQLCKRRLETTAKQAVGFMSPSQLDATAA